MHKLLEHLGYVYNPDYKCYGKRLYSFSVDIDVYLKNDIIKEVVTYSEVASHTGEASYTNTYTYKEYIGKLIRRHDKNIINIFKIKCLLNLDS